MDTDEDKKGFKRELPLTEFIKKKNTFEILILNGSLSISNFMLDALFIIIYIGNLIVTHGIYRLGTDVKLC